MTGLHLALTAAALVTLQVPAHPLQTPRPVNPLAPSLPLLTDDEEEQIDKIVDRFILADTGKLRGPEAKQAFAAFQKLGPEATPGLIRGLNKAAGIEHSCPVVTIAQKLSRTLSATEDRRLLEFARENIGSGVGPTRHANVLKDLRVTCIVRNGALVRRGVKMPAVVSPVGSGLGPGSAPQEVGQMKTAELVEAAARERGPRLKAVLTELGKRTGEQAVYALAGAATAYADDVRQLARDQLVNVLAGESLASLKGKLTDDRAEVRAGALRAAARKELRWGDAYLERLSDANAEVRRAARAALVKIARGIDYGPKDDANERERADALARWRAWWAKQ